MSFQPDRVVFRVVNIAFLCLFFGIAYMHLTLPTYLRSVNVDNATLRGDLVRGDIMVGEDVVAYSVGSERVYPFGALYGNVVGVFRGDSIEASGVERAFDSELREPFDRHWAEPFVSFFDPLSAKGQTIHLTLDPALQSAAFDALRGRRGAIFAFDPRDGAVKVQVSVPTFDPNVLVSSSDPVGDLNKLRQHSLHPTIDRTVNGDGYPPGSVFKLVIASAALRAGATLDAAVDSPIAVAYSNGELLNNIDGSSCGAGYPSLAEAFARSCNTTFALLALERSAADLDAEQRRFGFGVELGFEIPVARSVPASFGNSDATMLSAIGQGDLRVTPFHMASIAAAIGSGGSYHRPTLISGFSSSRHFFFEKSVPGEPVVMLEPEIADSLKEMMRQVVEEAYGSAFEVGSVEGEIALKTGTSEVGPDGDTTVAWAVGFAPVDNPSVAFAVVIEGDESNASPRGGSDAAPIAHDLFSEYASRR